MNYLHTYFKGLRGLPIEFPKRSLMPYKRLPRSVREGLKALRRADYTTLCDEFGQFVVDCGTDLATMPKRTYTVFRHLYRLWIASARRYTQTLCHWGKDATVRDAEGVLPYRQAGGNINVLVYEREHPDTLRAVVKKAEGVYQRYQAMLLTPEGTQDFARAEAEADRVVVEYLKPKRVYLRCFDGRLGATLQELMDNFRQWVNYELTGDTRTDILKALPTGRWDVLELGDEVEEEDDLNSAYEDDLED